MKFGSSNNSNVSNGVFQIFSEKKTIYLIHPVNYYLFKRRLINVLFNQIVMKCKLLSANQDKTHLLHWLPECSIRRNSFYEIKYECSPTLYIIYGCSSANNSVPISKFPCNGFLNKTSPSGDNSGSRYISISWSLPWMKQ